MALWSLMINLDGGGSFGTQVSAPTPNRALRFFLEGSSLSRFLQTAGPGWPATFRVDDVVAFLPMTGLKEMHLCQLGRDGKYASVMLVKTVEASKPNSRSNGRAARRSSKRRAGSARRSPRR